jgi:hypothetical protein
MSAVTNPAGNRGGNTGPLPTQVVAPEARPMSRNCECPDCQSWIAWLALAVFAAIALVVCASEGVLS